MIVSHTVYAELNHDIYGDEGVSGRRVTAGTVLHLRTCDHTRDL